MTRLFFLRFTVACPTISHPIPESRSLLHCSPFLLVTSRPEPALPLPLVLPYVGATRLTRFARHFR